MGRLDDAIKEHLDLKRRHGADDSEVKRLEDEAFGPPTRPGEPDFPDSQEHPVVGAGEAPVDADAAGAQSGAEDATALLEREAPAVPSAAPPASEAPVEAPPEPTTPEEPPSTPPPSEPEPPPEPEAPATPEAPPEPATPEPGGEDAAFYDQDVEAGDLGLGDEEAGEATDAPETAEQPEPPSEEPPAAEHPVAGLETEEHPMEELLADEAGLEIPPAPGPPATEEEPLPEEPGPAPPETGEEPAEGGSPATDPEGEDVLEETPEFLRDQPEDDELWFEQGEPKDFDF
jgi:hypothetical protein